MHAECAGRGPLLKDVRRREPAEAGSCWPPGTPVLATFATRIGRPLSWWPSSASAICASPLLANSTKAIPLPLPARQQGFLRTAHPIAPILLNSRLGQHPYWHNPAGKVWCANIHAHQL